MKVDIIGGGPAGLYFAILAKKAWPQMRITVYERNRADDTFGFGVVFSDETLETFEKYDLESYRAITGELRLLGRHRDPLQGHGAPHRRQRLLRLRARDLAASCCTSAPAQLGVELKFQTEVDPAAAARCRPRRRGRRHQFAHPRAASRMCSSPSTDLRPNKFAWMGSTRPFDAFTFFFRETEHGIFIAHCYQYEPGQSTWVMETDPETFARAGLDKLDEAAVGAIPRRRVRQGARRPQAHHQPLALAQLPDHPLREAGRTTTSC